MKRSLFPSIGSAIPLSLLLSAYIVASETLHLALRNRYFAADLGTAFVRVIACYAAFAVVVGALVGAVVRERRVQAFVIAVAGYLLISLKVFWLDAHMLAIPSIAVVFVAFTCAWLTAAVFIEKRLDLPESFPIVLTLAYANVCLGIASGWTLGGGRLLPFLLAPRTLKIVFGCLGVLIGVTAVHRWTVRRDSRGGALAILLGQLVALILGTVAATRRLPRIPEPDVHTAQGGPDVYVLSFDALRTDMLDAYVTEHPASNLARIDRQATNYENVVSHGLATDEILANNTLAGSRTRCAGSVPGALARRGYFTAMLFGRVGGRFEGSDCYEYYFSGDHDSLVSRFSVPALVKAFADDAVALRHNMLGAGEIVGKVRQLVATSNPLYVYAHFLELHAPYVPEGERHNPASEVAMREFMRLCYATACDLSDTENAQLVDNAKRAYTMLLDEVDRTVGEVLEIVQRRNRPFVVVVTADHGELFGEHGGFGHSGGFVGELLHVPFLVMDSRDHARQQRCALMLSSEAVRAVVTSVAGVSNAVYPDRDALDLVAPPLGQARIDKGMSTIQFQLSEGMLRYEGTWRNIHHVEQGTLPYPIKRCQ